MRVGLLFFIDTLLTSHDNPQGILGRSVANHDFLKACLIHDAVELKIFVTTDAERQYLQNYLQQQNMLTRCEVLTYQQIRKNPPEVDVIHTLDVNMYRAFFLRDSLFQKNIPVTGVTHTLGHAPFLDWLTLNLMHQPQLYDRLVCTTPTAQSVVNHCMEELKDSPLKAERLVTDVIPLGIFSDSYKGLDRSLRPQLSLSDDEVLFTYVGRLSARLKTDLKPLLQAFAVARSQSSVKIRLMIAGAAGQEGYAQELQGFASQLGVESSVQFQLNPDEALKRKILGASDVFVALSDNSQETFGLSVIEAMTVGLPVLCSDWDGYRFLVEQDVSGRRVKTWALPECDVVDPVAPAQLDSVNQLFLSQTTVIDLDELTQSLLTLAHDKELRIRLGEGACQRSQVFDWNSVISQYVTLWAALAEQAGTVEFQKKTSPVMNYHHVFAGYPTHLVSPETSLQTTDLGRQALTGQVNVMWYGGLEEVLQTDLMAFILQTAEQNVTLASLCEQTPASLESALVPFHVMWLAKSGYLKLKESQ